ncbi:30S ribosomal protein S6 [Poriferisphaera sp. WC338]|uniref:30S ribosomal protein S6 n=1 Tax=Poriferisphaera sp. WC338 TaxID=3425129 RepID=UPI003D812685
MSDNAKHLYEGMFLMGQAAGADLNGAMEQVQTLLDRAKAEVVAMNKWDERKLAYPIDGMKRGLYIQTLFNVEGANLAKLERDCNLSEQIVRVLFTRGDHLGETEIAAIKDGEKTTAAEAALKTEDVPAEAAAAEAPAKDAPAAE